MNIGDAVNLLLNRPEPEVDVKLVEGLVSDFASKVSNAGKKALAGLRTTLEKGKSKIKDVIDAIQDTDLKDFIFGIASKTGKKVDTLGAAVVVLGANTVINALLELSKKVMGESTMAEANIASVDSAIDALIGEAVKPMSTMDVVAEDFFKVKDVTSVDRNALVGKSVGKCQICQKGKMIYTNVSADYFAKCDKCGHMSGVNFVEKPPLNDSKPTSESKNDSLTFNALMDMVRYLGDRVEKPYKLVWGSKTYTFKDTDEIVPFMEKQLGVTITQQVPESKSLRFQCMREAVQEEVQLSNKGLVRVIEEAPAKVSEELKVVDPSRKDVEASIAAIKKELGIDSRPQHSVYLLYQDEGSNKFHYFAVFETEKDKYAAVNAYGRVGYDPQVHVIAKGSLEDVKKAMDLKVGVKSKKGYSAVQVESHDEK